MPKTNQEAKGEKIVFPPWCVSRNVMKSGAQVVARRVPHQHDIFLAGDCVVAVQGRERGHVSGWLVQEAFPHIIFACASQFNSQFIACDEKKAI